MEAVKELKSKGAKFEIIWDRFFFLDSLKILDPTIVKAFEDVILALNNH